MGHVPPGSPVQKTVFALAGGDAQLAFTGHIVQLPGVDPGGVHNGSGQEVALIGGSCPAAALPLKAGDLRVKAELHAVFGRALPKAQGQLEGADNAGGLCQQCPADLVGKIGLQDPGLVPA